MSFSMRQPAIFPCSRHCLILESDEQYHLFILDQNRFEPIINVLVTQATSPDGLTRFVIRSQTRPR